MRALVLLPCALLLLGCPKTPWCDRLNPDQVSQSLRTCVWATTLSGDAARAFTPVDGAPLVFSTEPRDLRPDQAELRDGTRLTGQPWGVSWSVPVGDPDAERVVDRIRRKTVREDSVGRVVGVGVSPDDARYALGLADGRLLVRTLDHRPLFEARAAEGTTAIGDQEVANAMDALAFSPDGALLVTGDRQRTVEVWTVATGERRWHVALDGGVWDVAVSPDGRLVAAGTGNGTVHVWDAASGAPVAVWLHPQAVVRVAFTDGGDHVVARVAGEHTTAAELERQRWRSTTQRAAPSGGITDPDVVALWRLP